MGLYWGEKRYSLMGSRAAKGLTLVGLMAGLLVSTLGILGMLAAYKQLVSAEVSASSYRSDGQIALGLLIVQMELQGAGFGIEGAAVNSDLLVLDIQTAKDARETAESLSDGFSFSSLNGSAATLSLPMTFSLYDKTADTQTAMLAILWDRLTAVSDSGGSHSCAGILLSYATLTLLKETACTGLGSYSSIQWQPETLVDIAALSLGTSESGLSALGFSQLALTSESCWPFAKTPTASTGQNSLKVAFSITPTAVLADASVADNTEQSIVSSTCIPNISGS